MSTMPTDDHKRPMDTWLNDVVDKAYNEAHPKKQIIPSSKRNVYWNRFLGLFKAVYIKAKAFGNKKKIENLINDKLDGNEISSATLYWFKDKTIAQIAAQRSVTSEKVTQIGRQIQQPEYPKIKDEASELEQIDKLFVESLEGAYQPPQYGSVLSPSDRLEASSTRPLPSNREERLRVILCINPTDLVSMDLNKVPHREGIRELITSFEKWHSEELGEEFDSFDPMAQLYLYEYCPSELEDTLIEIITKNVEDNHPGKRTDFIAYLETYKDESSVTAKYERLLKALRK